MSTLVEDNARKLSVADGLAKLRLLREEYTAFYEQIASMYCTDEVVKELMQMRGYNTQEMYDTLKQVGITRVSHLSDLDLCSPLSRYKTAQDWGLLDRNGNYLLADRYVVPIRDIMGKITALVGWFPDDRKYVTTPTFGFSKDAQFFNMDWYSVHLNKLETDKEYKDNVYLVEGIFDTLSIRSLGLFAVGNMGLGLSPVKREILKRFGHIYAIPDADKAGRGVLPFKSSGSSKYKWKLDYNTTFVEISIEGIKDPDDLIKNYDCKADLLNLNPDTYIDKIRETKE